MASTTSAEPEDGERPDIGFILLEEPKYQPHLRQLSIDDLDETWEPTSIVNYDQPSQLVTIAFS